MKRLYRVYSHRCRNNKGELETGEKLIAQNLDLSKGCRIVLKDTIEIGDYIIISPQQSKSERLVIKPN